MKTTLFSESSCKGTLLSTRGGSISNLHKTGTKHPERDSNEKLHHIVLVLALAATLFTGCTKDEGVTPRPPVPETADQTIMFYLTGTNLGSYFRKTSMTR